MDGIRCDKWLWAARFYKTRGLAQEAIDKGRVKIADERIKPARAIKIGDVVKLEQGDWEREVKVLGLSDKRGSAPVAQALYEDTADSLIAKEKARVRRTLFAEPAENIKGRPSKKDRRDLSRAGGY